MAPKVLTALALLFARTSRGNRGGGEFKAGTALSVSGFVRVLIEDRAGAEPGKFGGFVTYTQLIENGQLSLPINFLWPSYPYSSVQSIGYHTPAYECP